MTEWMVRIEPVQPAAEGAEWLLQAFAGPAGDRPLGRLLLRREAGVGVPRHWYHLGTSVHVAPELGLYRPQQTLLLGSDLTGGVELAAGRLDERGPAAATARALVQVALAWLARTPPGPPGWRDGGPRVFGELPGWRDGQGLSPFWQDLGQHFAPFTPAQAERRFGPAWPRDLAPLLPRHPLMAALLTDAARAAIGRAAPEAAPWAEAFADEGLAAGDHVTIVDGGPVHEARLGALPRVRASRWATASTAPDAPGPRRRLWLARAGQDLWHAVTGRLEAGGKGEGGGEEGGERVWLPAPTLAALGIAAGERVWCTPADTPSG